MLSKEECFSIEKSEPALTDFVQFCKDNPDYRFWQALSNWSGYMFVYVSDENIELPSLKDTYYLEEGKRPHD